MLPHGEAIQYRIASGAEYMGWTGRATVGAMKEWPTWMPTASIMERWPQFQVYKQHGPLEGRWDNPLGARALYLYQGNHDTLIRVHGTNEPSEIGGHVSSGCIRMRDMDVIDLYSRVHVGTPVMVMVSVTVRRKGRVRSERFDDAPAGAASPERALTHRRPILLVTGTAARRSS